MPKMMLKNLKEATCPSSIGISVPVHDVDSMQGLSEVFVQQTALDALELREALQQKWKLCLSKSPEQFRTVRIKDPPCPGYGIFYV